MNRSTLALIPLLLAAALLAQPTPSNPIKPPTDPIDPSIRDPIDPSKLAKPAKAPKLLAVKLHADWCPGCKTMGAMFEDLGRKFDSEPILFIKLDLTDQRGRTQAEYMLSALSLGKLWQELGEGKRTGQIVLIDPGSRKVVGVIPHDADWERAQKVLGESIKK